MLARLLHTVCTVLPAFCLALAAFPAAGCRTPLVFAAPLANWQTWQGQMHYTGADGRSLVGDVLVRRSPDAREFRLHFTSGPGIALMKLSTSGDLGEVEGALARGHWQGSAGSAPKRLLPWLRLQEVFAQAAPGHADLRGPGWSATALYRGGVLQQCQISFTESGERFAFHFGQ